ncbi:hypothetical protein D9758_007755 [Tetrapyrgos nigripes]|uniref:Carboxypeptidase n=1 Tax=Tetrapyrgos nigripes TaxID=182062 RepID=A0A8H5G577_9AGAR|nr:hypothetical protein D9758_007755 [Tetrapyrgos nigripes]
MLRFWIGIAALGVSVIPAWPWTTVLAANLPSTFPHNYTGIPSGDFSPEWQEYFLVKDPLPNVTTQAKPDTTQAGIDIDIARNFAGNIAVDRQGHPNNTLWFWAFEKENGSLTVEAGEREDEPWLIWLNGGPGSSSLVGLMTENGPLQVTGDFSIVGNNFSWNKLADAFWVDQPVGTGFSTSDATGYVLDEDQMGQDFLGFLTNLVKVFPSLATRPFYLTGESYAGTFIPYIAKTIFSTPNPPVNLKKIVIGDGTIGGFALYEEISTVNTLETYPAIINFDPDVFLYFKEQLSTTSVGEHLCNYDINLTYPQTGGHFPPLVDPFDTTVDLAASVAASRSRRLTANARKEKTLSWARRATGDMDNVERRDSGLSDLTSRAREEREEKRLAWKRDLTGRPNGTLDPMYGCFLYEEMLDYAENFTFPWTVGEFDPYDIPDALRPEVPSDPSIFLNDVRTRSALHAPIKEWVEIFGHPFGNFTSHGPGRNPFGDPSVEPMAFMTELAANASAKGVNIVIYEGNDDSLVAHRGLQVVIQVSQTSFLSPLPLLLPVLKAVFMTLSLPPSFPLRPTKNKNQNITFGGIQGFTRKPATPFFDDDGTFAGIVHQERNITYALFPNAGHFVPRSVPQAAFVFLREFILGSNTTGLVEHVDDSTDNGAVVVVGGEDPVLGEDVLPGTNVIFYGHGTTASSLVIPSETFASWSSFIATATATASGVVGPASTAGHGLP